MDISIYCDMMAESQNSRANRCDITMQWCSKHISAATDTGTTIEDMVFSMRSVPLLYDEEQLHKPISWRLELAVSSLELHC
jgi:hypothetical protein